MPDVAHHAVPGALADGIVALSPGAPEARPAPPHRRKRRLAIGGVVAMVVAGAAFAASGAGLLGSDGGTQTASGVPEKYVGTWSGPVERAGDGEPRQYRRFVIARGSIGEFVTRNVDLGLNYECTSDGKLISAKGSLTVEAKVIKSVPKGKCSAPSKHTLSPGPDSTLQWEAHGSRALLHKVRTPERLPEAFLGTWQRRLSGGGTPRLTVQQLSAERKSVALV
jgi:hypothetical protein